LSNFNICRNSANSPSFTFFFTPELYTYCSAGPTKSTGAFFLKYLSSSICLLIWIIELVQRKIYCQEIQFPTYVRIPSLKIFHNPKFSLLGIDPTLIYHSSVVVYMFLQVQVACLKFYFYQFFLWHTRNKKMKNYSINN